MQNPYKIPELVSLTTQDINDAEPITTSLKIAEMFEKQHKHVEDCREVFEHLLQMVSEEKTNKNNENNQPKSRPISKDFFFKELDYIDDRIRSWSIRRFWEWMLKKLKSLFLGMDDREIYERVKGHFFGS